MALISYVDDSIYQEALRSQQVANLLRVLFHSPIWAEAFVRLATIQMTKLKLEPSLRELVILQTSRMLQSEYVWAQHQGISQAAGVSEEQRAALNCGEFASEIFSEKSKALLQFVSGLEGSASIPAEDFAHARKYFSEQELVEVISIHGFAYVVAKITSKFAVDVDPVRGTDMLEFVKKVAGTSNGALKEKS
jgi:4-carboxymuconolactone decarboxylase